LIEILKDIDALSDNDLIRHYLETMDSSCFSIIYKRYANKVYGKCLTLLKDDYLAQDAMQDIFMKIFLNLASYGERAKFSTWVYSVSYNYCIDIMRKDKKNNLFSEDIDKAVNVKEEVEDAFLIELELSRLKKIMEVLPTGDKAILMMKYNDDLSIKEIAEILNKTESAIKMQIKRAKQKAKNIYNELYPF